MSQWKKDKQGRFLGSVGDGKSRVPTPNSTPSSVPHPAEANPPVVAPHYDSLVQRVRAAVPREESEPFAYLAAAEAQVDTCAQEWESTREWAYPGVGDLDAEEQLQRSYERLALAKENLHRARLLAAQTPEGQRMLEDQMTAWSKQGEQQDKDHEGALKYLVRAQEINDVLTEARRQREVEQEFQRIIKEARQPLGGQ